MGSDSEVFRETDIESLHRRLIIVEHSMRTQRRMLAPVCLITAGAVLAFASFGLIPTGEASSRVIEGWVALFTLYVLVLTPLTALTVASRASGPRAAAATGWMLMAILAVCTGAGVRPGLAEALGVGPWYLLVAAGITIVGLLRLPVKAPGE